MTILFKILTTVDLETKTKEEEEEEEEEEKRPTHSTKINSIISFHGHSRCISPPQKKKKFLVQAFQAGFKYLSLVSLLLYTSQSAIVIKLHL